MADTMNEKKHPELERIADPAAYEYQLPSKRINDGDDLTFFFASTAYRDLLSWLLQLTRAMFPEQTDEGKVLSCTLDKPPHYSKQVLALQSLLHDLLGLIDQAPPDTGARRFGNISFRKWFQLAEQKAPILLQRYLGTFLPTLSGTKPEHTSLLDELKVYLLGSFGSSQRLDYGTGHELSFLAFLACLWKVDVFDAGEEQAIVIGIVQPYLALMRKLILTYTLEPAGSHGVWGLDDHSFVPYIFGSAQLGPPIKRSDVASPLPTEGSLPEAPSPASVANKAVVADYRDINMYFSAIQFIYDVKTGPFWEHSPVLYDISGIKDGWGKINKGMLKMYAAEVLGKFPVVQHFPFGSLFSWQRDPRATETTATFHAQQQPPQSKDVPPVASIPSGTAAPWSHIGNTTLPQMQASTGMPSTRAPWASNSALDRHMSTTAPRMAAPRMMAVASARMGASNSSSDTSASTAAPWASNGQPGISGVRAMPSTAAPWAKKDSGS